MLIERILVALEEAADERFVHDRDVLCRLVVGGGEVTSANELHAQVLKVVRADAIPRRAGLFARLRRADGRRPARRSPQLSVSGL